MDLTDVKLTVPVLITTRSATCDFCGQHNQDCWQAPNSEDADICAPCVVAIAKSLGTVKMVSETDTQGDRCSSQLPNGTRCTGIIDHIGGHTSNE